MDECIESLGEATISRSWTLIAAIGKGKSPMKIAKKALSLLIAVYSALPGCNFVLKRIQDVSTLDGHHSILGEVAVCTGLS